MRVPGALRLVGSALALSALAWAPLLGVGPGRSSHVLVLGAGGALLVALGELLDARSRR